MQQNSNIRIKWQLSIEFIGTLTQKISSFWNVQTFNDPFLATNQTRIDNFSVFVRQMFKSKLEISLMVSNRMVDVTHTPN